MPMRPHLQRLCVVALITVFQASTVLGATAAIKAAKINDVPIEPSSSITVQPGDLIEAEVYISDWNTDLPGSGLQTYQVTFNAFSFFQGEGSGTLIPLGWDAMPLASCIGDSLCPIGMPLCRGHGYKLTPWCGCDTDADCPSFFPTCLGVCAGPDHDAQAAIFVNTERKDFVHFGFKEIAAARGTYASGNPSFGSTAALSGIGPLDAGQALYGGTLVLRVSSDACGLLTVEFMPQTPALENNFVDLRLPDLREDHVLAFSTLIPLQVLVTPEDTCGSATAAAVSADPPVGAGLSHADNNAVELAFDEDVNTPIPGELVVYELRPDNCSGPAPGDDLSAQLNVGLDMDEQNRPRTLRIRDTSGVFEHGKWYRVVNNGTWPGVVPFEVEYRVLAGDANNDGIVQFADLAVINQAIPTLRAKPTDRNDINGDGFVNFADLAAANVYIATSNQPNPCK